MASSASIRAAREEDLDAIVGLLADDELGRQRETKGGALTSSYLQAFQQIKQDSRNQLLVAEEKGHVVATLQLTYIPSLTHQGGERAQVEGIQVAEKARGKGVGKMLVEQAVNQARKRGCRMIQLTTDKQRPEAVRFYESLGFEATHEGMKLLFSAAGNP